MKSSELFKNLDNLLVPFKREIAQAHCYLINLSQVDLLSLDKYSKLLSGDEYEASIAILNKQAKFQYIYSRAILRHILAYYLCTEPEILIGEHGKPYLQGEKFHFNLSHSGNWLFIGMCNSYPIGVDVEQIRPMPEWVLIEELESHVSGFFNYDGQKSKNVIEFYQRWVKNEAFLKAIGIGIIDSEFKPKISIYSDCSIYENIFNNSCCIAAIVLSEHVSIDCSILEMH